MDFDPHHRKVDLQSPADLAYLLSNIRASAQEKLDNAFPPSAAPKDGEDAFMAKVEALVQEYITTTLTLSLPSLALNGLPASPSLLQHTSHSGPSHNSNTDPTSPSTSFLQSTSPSTTSTQNYEPYDPRLATKLREAYALLEEESTRVAELRREAPGAAARQFIEGFQRGEEERGEAERKWDEEVLGQVQREEEKRVKAWGKVEREEDVRESWESGRRELREIGEGIAGVRGKCERAGEVVKVVQLK